MSGPLSGVVVVELAALAPVSMAGMMLADMGARVIRIDPAADLNMLQFGTPEQDPLRRGRESIALDLKDPRGRRIALELIERADVLIESFRPGVCERLGIGPDDCLARNAALVYGRLSGWGQTGPWAQVAGHDIGYLAISGTLSQHPSHIEAPMPYLNYVADFGAGTMLLLVGVLAALREASVSGHGQVVDAAMVDGVALFSTHTAALELAGVVDPHDPDHNFLLGAAPFYRTYRCADGEFLSVGAAEPGFYQEMCALFELRGWDEQWDRAAWPERVDELTALIATETRDEWCRRAEPTQACIAPVLTFDEARQHPQLAARGTYAASGSGQLPAPAPRFSNTSRAVSTEPIPVGAHTEVLLAELGYGPAETASLTDARVVASAVSAN